MPRLGADMDAGTLVAWRKQPGEPCERGEIIAEVETDKGVIEIEAFADGVDRAAAGAPGDNVPVGTVARDHPSSAGGIVRQRPPSRRRGRAVHRHADLARRAAAGRPSCGVDPGPSHGTGPRGTRVAPRRSEQAARLGRRPAHAGNGRTGSPPPRRRRAAAAGRRRRRRGCARRSPPPWRGRSGRFRTSTCARRSTWSTPSTWLAEENQRRPLTERLLYGVLLMKAVALALRDVPELNAVWQDGRADAKPSASTSASPSRCAAAA